METIWSNRTTVENLLSLDREELEDILVDAGYDRDMISGVDLEELIYDDIEMFSEEDEEEFENIIVPMIAKQTYNGIVIIDEGDKLKSTDTDNLLYSLAPEYDDELYLYNDNGNLTGKDHNGLDLRFFVIPEDNPLGWVKEHLKEAVEDYLDMYNDNGDITFDEAAHEVLNNIDEFISGYGINNYCNAEDLDPVKVDIEVKEDVEELDEAKSFYSKDVEKLVNELEELRADYEDFGPDGFYAVPLNRFEKEFPEFYNGIISTFLDSIVDIKLDEEDPEELNAAWQDGELITKQDWPALFEGADVLIENDGKGYGWMAIWKKYYNTFE